MDLSDVWFNIARDSPAFLNLFAFERPMQLVEISTSSHAPIPG